MLPIQAPITMGEKITKAMRSDQGFSHSSSSPVCLTVWRKSLLFNGNGYTVYDDSNGRMVFRVENYACNWREETYLMDSAGNVLITIQRCRKKLSILESWEAYRGDRDVSGPFGQQKPLFRATKALGAPSCKIFVTVTDKDEPLNYQMNWSRQKGWSKIFQTTSATLPIAEVNRKCGVMPQTLLGKDVVTLRVQPGVDQAMVMAMLMINDAMR
ncbi:protein LURP-one-related 8-like [Tasmannia lanceolata]|uniref:protein LURP-one-related 8-like n=1 Tax=Tasmannia lanceolata TaxID=3420 RepID=UPI0040645120